MRDCRMQLVEVCIRDLFTPKRLQGQSERIRDLVVIALGCNEELRLLDRGQSNCFVHRRTLPTERRTSWGYERQASAARLVQCHRKTLARHARAKRRSNS